MFQTITLHKLIIYTLIYLDTHLTQTGTIGLEMSFASATGEAFQTIEYGVFHTALVIDKDRLCSIEDNI